MARINHNNFVDSVNELIKDATQRGILQLHYEDYATSGRSFLIENKELINFGTCGYLGLEMDERLKNGAIEFTKRYGVQFSVSRTYLSTGNTEELEGYIKEIYGTSNVMVFPSTSTAHIAIIPTIIRDRHSVIMDQQVHMSIQTACQLLRQKGTTIEMIRHSNLEMLERTIKNLGDKYEKIWYMIDGVYSMYGELAPLDELLELMDKYSQLHLYIDDAHGMSWYGKNGCGFAFDRIGLNPKVMLISTLAKGFGTVGGIGIFPDEYTYETVKNFGGPYMYSHPLTPPMVGASIEAAKIHLSEELIELQQDLQEKIEYCHNLLIENHLPVVSHPLTPIFFIGMGQPKVGYNILKRLIDAGFYTNIALFPAVPAKNTGVRFTMTRHVNYKDIDGLVNALAYHYPKALEEEGRTDKDVRKAFHLPIIETTTGNTTKHSKSKYFVEHVQTINKVNKLEWNQLLGNNGVFNSKALEFIEKAFSNNDDFRNNWEFHYFVIRNSIGEALLATFLTVCYLKDDMLSPASVSLQVEEKRKIDPMYLTSKYLTLGCLLTEGEHLFIDRTFPDWKEVGSLFIEELQKLQEKTNSSNILLRDFNSNDDELKDFFLSEGFFKLDMPKANHVYNAKWNSTEEFIERLSPRNRRHVRNDIFKFTQYFDVSLIDTLSDDEVEKFYSMYLQVKEKNYEINYFPYPKKCFYEMNKNDGWEFVVLKIKSEFEPTNPTVAICACYLNNKSYNPVLIGMDYEFSYKYKAYKQALFQVVKRANELNCDKISLGFSADIEKHKVGAKQINVSAFMQAKDNYNFEVIESMAIISEKTTV